MRPRIIEPERSVDAALQVVEDLAAIARDQSPLGAVLDDRVTDVDRPWRIDPVVLKPTTTSARRR